MDAPFVFITTHRIEEETCERFHQLSRELTAYVEANEPEMLAYYAFLSDDGSEISLMQVHRDAAVRGSSPRARPLALRARPRDQRGAAHRRVRRSRAAVGAGGRPLRDARGGGEHQARAG